MSLKFAKSLPELFAAGGARGVFDAAALQRILRAIEARIAPLEATRDAEAEAIERVRRIGLERIDTVLQPALEDIVAIQERGFLIARSATSVELAVGDVSIFGISDAEERRLFSPSPFLALTREASAEDYAIARLVSWDGEAGILIVQIVGAWGSPGPHSDWVIGALAGSTMAQLAQLEEGEAAAALSGAARDAAALAASAAAGSRDAAEAIRVATAAIRDDAVAQTGAIGAAAEAARADAESYRDTTLGLRDAAASIRDEAAGFRDEIDPSTYFRKADNLAGLADAAVARGNLGLSATGVAVSELPQLLNPKSETALTGSYFVAPGNSPLGIGSILHVDLFPDGTRVHRLRSATGQQVLEAFRSATTGIWSAWASMTGARAQTISGFGGDPSDLNGTFAARLGVGFVAEAPRLVAAASCAVNPQTTEARSYELELLVRHAVSLVAAASSTAGASCADNILYAAPMATTVSVDNLAVGQSYEVLLRLRRSSGTGAGQPRLLSISGVNF